MGFLNWKKLTGIAIVFLPYMLNAQISVFSFSFSSGPSFPVGNFKKTNFENGSFALTGVSFAFESEYSAFEKLGFGLRVNVNFHPVDVPALIREELNRDPFLLDLNIRSEPYQSLQLFAGAIYHADMLDGLTWNAGIYLGVCQAKSPYKLYEAEYFLLGEQTYRITSSGDIKPSALVSGGLDYLIKPYFSLHAGTEFSYTPVEFGFVTAQSRRVEDHDFMFLNVLAGFRVYL